MISKILLTIVIIAGVVLLVKFRNRVPPQPTPAAPDETAQGFRWLALFAVALILAGSAFFIWQTWRDASEVLLLQVVDTRSGKVTEYQAYRRDVEDRVFRTVDGRRISLAETERLEVRD